MSVSRLACCVLISRLVDGAAGVHMPLPATSSGRTLPRQCAQRGRAYYMGVATEEYPFPGKLLFWVGIMSNAVCNLFSQRPLQIWRKGRLQEHLEKRSFVLQHSRSLVSNCTRRRGLRYISLVSLLLAFQPEPLRGPIMPLHHHT